MATIDIGKIKPVFKGTYDNSTAYVLDDIVYYNGSSYVAKTSTTGNLPTDTTKWNIYASGSGGIWSSTLGIGTAGQVVKVNSGGTALEFGTDAGGSVLAVSHKIYGGTNEINTQNRESDFGNIVSNSYEISQLTITMTPSSTSSKFLWGMNLQACRDGSHVGIGWLTYQVAGGTEYAVASSGTRGVTFRYDDDSVGTTNAGNPSIAHQVMIAPNTTSAVTFRIRIANASSSYPFYINRNPSNSTDVDDGGYMLCTSTCMELDGSKSTKATTSVNETKT